MTADVVGTPLFFNILVDISFVRFQVHVYVLPLHMVALNTLNTWVD